MSAYLTLSRPRQRRVVLTNGEDTSELLETLKLGVVALLSSVATTYSIPSALTYSIGNGVTNVSWTPPNNAPVSGSAVSFINSYDIRYRLTSNASFTNVVGISSTASTYSIQLLLTENLIVQIRGVNTLLGPFEYANLTITAPQLPTASIITTDNTITAGESTTITPTFTGGTAQITVNGLPTFGVSPIISDTGYPVTPSVGVTTYNLIVTNGAGAQQSASVDITVSPAGPVAPGIFYTGAYDNGVSLTTMPYIFPGVFTVTSSVVRTLNFNLTFPIGTTRVRIAGGGGVTDLALSNLSSINIYPSTNQTSQSIVLNKVSTGGAEGFDSLFLWFNDDPTPYYYYSFYFRVLG